MPGGLDELFAFGTISKEFDVKGLTVRLNVLDAKKVQEALNASASESDEVARLLEYKKQILARSISHAGNVQYFEDQDKPKPEEIKNVLSYLNKVHVYVVNALYEFYDELDNSVKENIADEVKK